MSNTQETEPTPSPWLPLIREGWQHLQLQRPLAAWATWQRVLRAEPDCSPAVKALERLDTASELPPAARAVYRFRTPTEPARRDRWNTRLLASAQGLDDLSAAAKVFTAITTDDPADADAWLNLALCQAWLGRNAESVASLDRAGHLLATSDPEQAADAWTLAEVVRLGAGAEALADDFRYSWTVSWPEGLEPTEGPFDRWPNLVPVPVPIDPLTGSPALDRGKVYEWLDRTAPGEAGDEPGIRDVARVIATVVRLPGQLRISSPDPTGFALLDEPAFAEVREVVNAARLEQTPLTIAWADAAIGTFRYPTGLDEVQKATLARAVVEHYYENLWINLPRQALGKLSPIAAARAAAKGDPVARARLSAVVRFREQLGRRPTHAAVYQGYPFDRLRRRLGLLEPGDDANDLSCASEIELDQLDATGLDDSRLAEAFDSTAPLRNDTLTARFAAELVRRASPSLARLAPDSVFAPLVRESLRADEPDQALQWLDRAREILTADDARTFAVWSAEIHARTGNPDAALRTYQELLEHADAALALDGAETLLDNDHPEQAIPLLVEARDRARQSGQTAILRRAEQLIERGQIG